MLDSVTKNSLIWMPEKGIGYFPVNDFPYNRDYFKKYEDYAETEMGLEITQARIDLVARHYSGPLVDVGIGCGQFISNRENTFGFDVNPEAERWLKKRQLWQDIYDVEFDALTFWDSLEHIKNPSLAVQTAKKWVFVSIPIFHSSAHILRSKHFRKDEHFWYFTGRGLVEWFNNQGFDLIESTHAESELGREDIMSFAFRRRHA